MILLVEDFYDDPDHCDNIGQAKYENGDHGVVKSGSPTHLLLASWQLGNLARCGVASLESFPVANDLLKGSSP